MSSRRKSSTPCMVRVLSDLPEEQEEPEEVMDMEMLTDSSIKEIRLSDSSDNSQDPEQQDLGDEDQQMFAESVENQNPEPSEHEEQSSQEEQRSADEDTEGGEMKEKADLHSATHKKLFRGYECKYCTFSTQNLGDFKDHVDSSHPNVILNPLYLCAVCNFKTNKFDSLTEHNESQHPGETNFKFKRIKLNNQTVLEQTITGRDNSPQYHLTNDQGETNSDSLPPCISTTVKTPDSIQSLYQGGQLKSQLDSLMQKDQITALNINGTVIIPEPTILQGLSHVSPMLQRPPNFNSVPKIAVPLNTTKYNPSLDDNLTLITSFNKFPYPTHAELSWLTAASKHPEEQIKVWFTTQRLKQGITWSPEEVEEARKKMFNGSIPPAHHTFTVLPTSPVSPASAKAFHTPVVHTTVEHSSHFRGGLSNGLSGAKPHVTTATSYGIKRSLPTHMTTAFGPEAKRPVMAVAPHSGDPKEKGLMAPPPPPPPQKDRLPMAPPPVPIEMKRPVAVPLVSEVKRLAAAVPLMPPPSLSSSQSVLSKGKFPSSIGNPKTKPVVSLPSVIFPESLTRPTIAPPPIFAPPFNNSLLIPRCSPFTPKDKLPSAHASSPAADLKLPSSPPLIAPHIRRPPIIQSIHAPLKAQSQISGFPLDGNEVKASQPRGVKAPTPLSEANGTPQAHDQNPPSPNNGHVHGNNSEQAASKTDHQQKSSVMTAFPLLERMKGKTGDQLKILEENFIRNSFPTHSDVDNLSASSHLSHKEIDSWFAERRALRDNLEQALLNSMGSKRSGSVAVSATSERRVHQQQQSLELNGIHKQSTGVSHLKSPPAPIVAPSPGTTSTPNPPASTVPPVLKDDFAQTRWPSPEEFSQLEARTGLPRSDLIRWFNDSRLALQGGGGELAELFRGSTTGGVNGGHGTAVCSPENAPGLRPRCQEGGMTNHKSGKVLESELGRLMEQRANSLSSQHEELQDWFTGRLRQQNGGVALGGGGGRDVFGSWLEDGHSRRGRELLLLDRDKKMEDTSSGRLTG